MQMPNRGLILKPREEKDFVLGGKVELGGIPLMPNGHGWGNFLPDIEVQNANGVETYACTSFGTLSAIEILAREVFGLPLNFSDRHSAITSGTDPYVIKGNDPKTIIETARKQGLIPETDLPFSSDINTVQRFYSPRPMTEPYIGTAQNFLQNYKINYEWVDTGPQRMIEALQFSPLGVAGYAWAAGEDGTPTEGLYITPPGATANHWFCVYDYVPGVKWLAWDSYDGDLKELAWDYQFAKAMRYSLTKNTDLQQISIMQQIIDALLKLIGLYKEKIIIETPQLPPLPVPVVPPVGPQPSRLTEFCLSIQKHEGWYPKSRSYRNCSPGNFRYTSYIASLGATGHDAQNYAIFPSYEAGFGALKQFVRDAGMNKLKDYHDKDILGFFKVFAPSGDNNLPVAYANSVAKQLGVPVVTPIKDLL